LLRDARPAVAPSWNPVTHWLARRQDRIEEAVRIAGDQRARV
jgi:hypothetical protein